MSISCVFTVVGAKKYATQVDACCAAPSRSSRTTANKRYTAYSCHLLCYPLFLLFFLSSLVVIAFPTFSYFSYFSSSFNIYLWCPCLSSRTQQPAAARPPYHPLRLRMMPTALLPNKATNAQIQSADSQLQVALPWWPLPAYARVAFGDARLVLPDKVHRIVGGQLSRLLSRQQSVTRQTEPALQRPKP